MNKKIEIQKIKVNNGQELIAKVKEHKNSGGEWKLLERHFTLPTRGKVKGWSLENNSEGFIISNGEQKLDIYLEGHREVVDLLTDDWDQIKAIFPEISQTCGSDDMPFKVPCKEINEGEKKVIFGRFLVAWSVSDIFKIIVDYYKENEAEIKKTVASLGFENSLKYWIKVGNDSDNIYIWLGKRDEDVDISGGGELQISINRKDLEKYSTGSYSRGGTVFWKDLNNQQMANELLEMRINPFWHLISSGDNKGTISLYEDYQIGFTNEKFEPMPRKNGNSTSEKNDNQLSLVGKKLLLNLDKISLDPIGYLANAEIVKGNEVEENYNGKVNNSDWSAWNDKVHQVEIEGEKINLTKLSRADKLAVRKAIIASIKSNPQDWKIENSNIYDIPSQGIPDSFKVLRHKSGYRHWNVGIIYLNESLEQGKKDWAEIEALLGGKPLSVNNSQTDVDWIKKYFQENDIHTITLDGNSLVIKYNNNKKEKKVEVENPQLQLIKQIVEQQKDGSLSFSHPLSTNNSPSNQNNHHLAIGLALGAGAVILVGVIVYFIRKRNKNNGKS